MACAWLLIQTRQTSQYVLLSFLYGCKAWARHASDPNSRRQSGQHTLVGLDIMVPASLKAQGQRFKSATSRARERHK
jgi:hypothetical protein